MRSVKSTGRYICRPYMARWVNIMKQRKNKGSGVIKGRSFALLLGFYGHDALKDIYYFIISKKMFKLKGCCSYRRIEIFSFRVSICDGELMKVSVQCPFLRSVRWTLLNLSMMTFLWKCCLYHCDIFLLTFSSVFGLRMSILPIVSAIGFFFFSLLSDPSGPCLAFGENSQSGLVFPIRGHVCLCVCELRGHLVCTSYLFFFVFHLTQYYTFII